MRRYLHCFIAITLLVAFSACHSIPDHAKYIPKDALLVVGLNTKSLGKKVAWQALMGSKLFKELQANMPDKQAVDKLESAGVDGMNTFYVYVKGDKRFAAKITALIPLADAGKWNDYVKTTFADAKIQEVNGRKEAMLYEGMYAGWNDKVLIVMNIQPNRDWNIYAQQLANGDTTQVAVDTDVTQEYNPADSTIITTTTTTTEVVIDPTLLAAEMEVAFGTTKDNALTGNKHFSKLEKDNHDIVFWMNYDELMSQYMGNNIAGMTGGLALNNNLWKNAAFAGGFDFEKGKIDGNIYYYASDMMKEIAKEGGNNNADKDMLNRLPATNLDMLVAAHIPPKSMKMTLEKMGFLGLANLALAQQNLTVEYILDAFTGDIALTFNDFAVTRQTTTTTLASADSNINVSYTASYKPSFSGVYTMKINKEENFKKLYAMLAQSGLQPIAANTYAIPLTATDSIYITTDNKYIVASNKLASTTAFLQGTNKEKLPEAAKAYGNPSSMYIDVQQFAQSVDVSDIHGADSARIAESKRLVTNLAFYGGKFEGDAYHYSMAINFNNKDENALLQLINFAMKMTDGGKSAAAEADNNQSAMAN